MEVMSILDDARFITDFHLGPYAVEFCDDKGKYYLRIYPRRHESHYGPPWIGIAWIMDPVRPGRIGSWRLFDLEGRLGSPNPTDCNLPDGFDLAPFLDIARDLGLVFPMEE
jgi:hypothetical protein